MKTPITGLCGLAVCLVAMTLSACGGSDNQANTQQPEAATTQIAAKVVPIEMPATPTPEATTTPTALAEHQAPKPDIAPDKPAPVGKTIPTIEKEAVGTPTPQPLAAPKQRPLPSMTLDDDGVRVLQQLADRSETIEAPGASLTNLATYHAEKGYLMAIFAQDGREPQSTKLAIYRDANDDLFFTTDELVTTMEIGAGVAIYASTFLENGEILFLDEIKNDVRRVADTNADGIPDRLEAKAYWSPASDKKFGESAHAEIEAKSTKRVRLLSTDGTSIYVIKDTNNDGIGDEGKVESR
ncbi:MAG: hypothetical protein KDB07_09360 [Planctomycetes bacterium]|nr:hypothetical protein [Planctomycetota bacterium]